MERKRSTPDKLSSAKGSSKGHKKKTIGRDPSSDSISMMQIPQLSTAIS